MASSPLKKGPEVNPYVQQPSVAVAAPDEDFQTYANITTIVVGITVVVTFVTTWLNKRLGSAVDKKLQEHKEANIRAINDAVDGVKRTSREHIENSIKDLEDSLNSNLEVLKTCLEKDLNHQSELIGQKISLLLEKFEQTKNDILLDREQTLSSQIELSQLHAKVEILSNGVDGSCRQ